MSTENGETAVASVTINALGYRALHRDRLPKPRTNESRAMPMLAAGRQVTRYSAMRTAE